MLVDEGWRVNVKRVYRIWRRAHDLIVLPTVYVLGTNAKCRPSLEMSAVGVGPDLPRISRNRIYKASAAAPKCGPVRRVADQAEELLSIPSRRAFGGYECGSAVSEAFAGRRSSIVAIFFSTLASNKNARWLFQPG